MIVYVESNFVLELTFLQEQHESCDAVVSLAEMRQISLVLPAISFEEPLEVLSRRSSRRETLRQQLNAEMRELSRSKPYADVIKESGLFTDLLVKSGEAEKERLHQTLTRLLDCAEVIPVGSAIIRTAIAYQSTLRLSPQDSIIYASVIAHLSAAPSEPKCFLNKNSKDFVNPYIEEELTHYGCRLITSFKGGLGHIEHQLRLNQEN